MHQPPEQLQNMSSQRLMLRAMADEDAAALLAIYGDPQVMQYTDEAPFPDLATVGVMLDSVRKLLANGTSLEWAIVLRETGQLIGTCGLYSFAGEQAELGCLLKRSAWGNGYMAEAIGLLTDYAKDDLHLKRLLADVAPDNVRARRVFRRLGYAEDANGILCRSLHGA